MFLNHATFGAIAAAALTSFAATAQAAVTISQQPTKNMSCSAGVCTPTKAKANLNVGDLAAMLEAGDAKVRSDGKALDIDIADALSWASAARLTLNSYRAITVEAPVIVTGTGAGLTIKTNSGGTGGDLDFVGKGRVAFWDLNDSLAIDGIAYTLENSIAALASDIAKNALGNFALADNYDAKADGTYHAAPIQTSYRGRLEGLGNTISHLRIVDAASNDDVGLFAMLKDGSVVENLILRKFDVASPTNDGVGGLAGMSYGTVRNVSADGKSVAANTLSGGLIGYNFGAIVDSRTSGRATGLAVGGLVGIDYGTISRSTSSSAVTTIGGVAGGLVSYEQGTVEDSWATGPVDAGKRGTAGGFAGNFYVGTIARSFATGAVKGQDSMLGGFVGALGVTAGDGYLTDDYAIGTVTGAGYCYGGGFAGYGFESFDLHLISAYSTGAVTAQGTEGGFLGRDEDPTYRQIANAYWDLDTSGIANPSQGAGDPPNDPGIAGLTDLQLKSALPAGFDPQTWGQDPAINGGYPYLLANPPH